MLIASTHRPPLRHAPAAPAHSSTSVSQLRPVYPTKSGQISLSLARLHLIVVINKTINYQEGKYRRKCRRRAARYSFRYFGKARWEFPRTVDLTTLLARNKTLKRTPCETCLYRSLAKFIVTCPALEQFVLQSHTIEVRHLWVLLKCETAICFNRYKQYCTRVPF